MLIKNGQKSISILLLLGLCLNLLLPVSTTNAMQALGGAESASFSGQQDLQVDPTAKIEPQVLLEIRDSGETDFFIWMVEKADLSPSASFKTKEEKGRFVFDTLRATAERTQKDVRDYLDSQGVGYQAFYIANKIFVRSGGEALAMDLAARPDVLQLTANHYYQLPEPIRPAQETDEILAIEPNISFVNADDVWALGVTGANTVMAGNDTGLDETHPAIARHYRGCLNPPDCTSWDHNYNWWDATGAYPFDPGDGHGHGTHTTGTMVGDDGGDNQIGMAPGAQTVHCKNMDDGGGGYDLWFETCFQWDLAPWDLSGANPDPAAAPDAINNSWGYSGGGYPQFEDEIAALQAAGIVVEVSAGNEGPYCSTLRSPSDYEEVLTTGSVNHAYPTPGQLTDFSSRGPSSLYPGDYFPDIMAPGENIRSSLPGGWYDYWSGTSMAGPHATALVGLMWSAAPALRGQVQQTIQIIKDSASPLTGQLGSSCGGDYTEGPNNDWGHGTIDALAAVQLAIALGGAGNLDGTVTDAVSGLPIEAATVRAVHDEGFAWLDQTDAAGYYTVTVAAGTFEVTASHPQYVSATVPAVEVITDTRTTQDFNLTPRGRLFGYVTDFDAGFGLAATVTSDDGSMTSTDPGTGYYEMYLDPGTHVITATATDYTPELFVVDLISGADTRQDFALKAAVAFVPSPILKTLLYGDTGTQVVTITNRLPAPYNFQFLEGHAGFIPTTLAGHHASGRGEWLYQASTGVPMENNLGENVLAYPSAYRWVADAPAQVSVLIYADDYYHPGPNTFLDQALQALGMSYTAHYNGDWWGFLSNLQSGSWDLVLVGNDYYVDTSIFSPLNDYVDAGGKLIINTWTMSWDPYHPLWSTLGVAWMADDWDPPDPVYWWDPSHGIFNAPESVPELTQLEPYRYGTYGQQVDWAGEFEALAGYTTPGTDPGQAALVLGNDGRTLFKGFLDGHNDADQDLDGMYDGAELWINMISGLESGFGGVPWFGQDPVAGTVPALSTINATMLFTATAEAGVDQPGNYYLTLTMNGEAGTPDVRVPVSMTVLAPDSWGLLEGTITGLGYCDGNPAPLEDAGVFIEAASGMTWTLQTDDSGHYQWWLDEAYSPLTVTVTYPEHELGQAAGVEIYGQSTTSADFDLRWLAPCVSADPTALNAEVEMGATAVVQLTLANTGAAGTPYEIKEKDADFIPAVQGSVLQRASLVSGEQAYARTTQGLNLPTMPEAAPLAAGDVLQTWAPFENDYAWGIAYDGEDETVWVGDGWTFENTIFEYLPDGTITGRAWPYTYGPTNGPADATFNWNTGMIWIASVGDGDCIHEIDPASGATGNVICPPIPIYAFRGLAYDPDTDTYFGGGWNDAMVYHFDSSGAILDSAFTGLLIAGLAYNPETRHLFVMVNDADEPVYVLDAANDYSLIGQFYISGWPGFWNGAGLEIDCDGNLWAVGQSEQMVYQFESGETATLCTSDVPWLSEDPVSGYLDADTGTQVTDVSFDASVPEVDQPGEYQASLKVKSDDPLNGTIDVPVTMNVLPPDTWGKLAGEISSQGHCDQNPWPLAEAQIVIESSTGVTWTIQSSADGSYLRWLDEAGSPYTLYVTAADHVAGDPVNVGIAGQQTTTQDISLRWMVPCLSAAPESYSVEIPRGFTIGYPFTLLNDGAGGAEFSLRDRIGQEPGLISTLSPALSGSTGPSLSTDASELVRVPTAPSQMLDADVLLIQDEAAWGIPAMTTILDTNGIPYDLINSGQISTWDFAPYKMIIIPSTQWQSYYDQFNTNLARFEAFIDGGGLLLMSFCTQGETVNIPFGGESLWDGQEYNYIVDPAHPIFAGVANPYSGSYASHNSLSSLLPDDVVLVTTGTGPGGNPVMIAREHGAGMLVAGGQTFEFGWGNAQDAGVILENMIPYFYYNWEAQNDAPWLAQDPAEGSVEADGSFDVELLFTAFPTMTVGSIHTATLVVRSNDLVYDNYNIPVTMTVIAPITAVAIDAAATQLVGEQSTIVTHTITVTNMSNHPDTYDLVLSDYWWATWGPTFVGPLWPGESATADIRVAIPPTVLPGSSDTVVVRAVSQANNTVFDSLALTTVAAEYVATLTPQVMALSALPGYTATYTLLLENTGNLMDTFVLTSTISNWDVHILGETSVGLGPGETHEVIVEVEVPGDAADGDWDMVLIEVYGVPGQVAVSVLTTTAAWARSYFPFVGYIPSP